MRFLISIILIAIIPALAFALPWWVLAITSFLVAVVMLLKPGKAFLAGFLGIAILWSVTILMRDIPNQHILSSRMAQLFGLGGYGLFMVVNIIVGALVGGLAAWCGGLMNKAFRKL